MIKSLAPVRGQDRQGSGAWHASRDGGKRKHNGVDFAVAKYSTVLNGVKGTVTKIGYPYNPSDKKKGHLRYIEITTDDKIAVRYFYVQPEKTIEVGQTICPGEKLGACQDLESIYPGMTNHVHLSVKFADRYMNPLECEDLFII